MYKYMETWKCFNFIWELQISSEILIFGKEFFKFYSTLKCQDLKRTESAQFLITLDSSDKAQYCESTEYVMSFEHKLPEVKDKMKDREMEGERERERKAV